MKKLYILISLLLLSMTGNAQWDWTTLKVGIGGLYSISCVNENVTYVCGNGASIVKTADGGKTWTLLNSESGILFQSIKFIDEQTGFVGGGTVSGGTSTPDEGGGIVWKTTDGGQTWQDITPPDRINMVNGFFAVDKDTLYILQDESGNLLKSIDGGVTWNTAFSLIPTESMMNFYMVDSVAYVVAFGYYTGGRKIYQTRDYANTWQEVYRNSSLILNPSSSDLMFFHPDTVYVYMPDSLLYTTNGFVSYTKYPYETLYSYGMAKVKQFPNGNYCLIKYSVHNGSYFYGEIWGYDFESYPYNVYHVCAVDGVSDSVFYVLQYDGTIYTNRYFEQDTNNVIALEKEDDFVLYPNPTTGELRMENGEWRMDDIEIYDVMGRSVYLFTRPRVHSSTIDIDISHLPAGIYFIRINTETGMVMKKIIKE